MPVFEFRATDREGKAINGNLVSESFATASAQLSERGYNILHLGSAASVNDPVVPPAAETSGRDISTPRNFVETNIVGPLVGVVPLKDLLFFFRQLATMLSAGVNIVQSMDTLSKQTGDAKLRTIIREAREHVMEGRPMSAGLQRYPEVFTPLMMSLIRVGEKSGFLDKALSQSADYIEREIELRNLIRRVTIYPKLVIGASILIIIGANAVLAMLNTQSRLSSPLTSPATWLLLGPLIVGAFLFFRVGVKVPSVKQLYDNLILRIPGIGKTIHMLAMAKFGRSFAALYSGGVGVPEAVRLSADACGSEELRKRIYDAAGGLEEGAGITETFARTGAFSPILLDMVRTGETTGNLDVMLTKVGDYYEDEAKTRSVQSATILGVVCLLAVAIYVGYIVVTFYIGHFSGLAGAASEA